MNPKPWYKSVTLAGALAALVGTFEVIMAEPTLLQPFVDIGWLGDGGAQAIAKVLAIGGAVGAIVGRVRKTGGAPLTM